MKPNVALTWDTVRELPLPLPGVEEGTSYGTPALKVRGKLFVCLHQDGDSLVVHVEDPERRRLLKADPAVFHLTDHYKAHPWVLVRLAAVSREKLAPILLNAWRLRAPKNLLAEYDASA